MSKAIELLDKRTTSETKKRLAGDCISEGDRDNIFLDDWYKEHVVNLLNFKKWWIRENQKNPENFPMEMWYGNWEEQFDTFES